MSIKLKKWVQTINTWADDFYAIPICPHCKVGTLIIEDLPTKQENVINRHVKCNNCGITETFTMPTPQYPGYPKSSN